MLEMGIEHDFNGNPCDICKISPQGIDWLLENRDRFRMTQEEIAENSSTESRII